MAITAQGRVGSFPEDCEIMDRNQRSGLSFIRAQMREKGLFDFQPLYYFRIISLSMALLGINIWALLYFDNLWILLGGAVFLGLLFPQFAGIGHDAGHDSISKSAWINYAVGSATCFIFGMSRTWWRSVHGEHHTEPNGPSDPHKQVPNLVFSEEEALLVRGYWRRLIIGYQAWYFVPYMALESIHLRVASVKFLFSLWRTKKERVPWIEPVIMGAHFAAYFGLLWLSSLSFWEGVGFVVVHYVVFGIYFGLIFAPNHKGMGIPDPDNPWDSVRKQVLTSRGVKPGFFARLIYAGLERQVEHHLVPTRMPRCNLEAVREILIAYCAKEGIHYEEVSIWGSQKAVLKHLRDVSASLRRPPAKSAFETAGE